MKLTEEKAITLVKERCLKLSTKDEFIEFLGWNGKFCGLKSKLCLRNSVFGEWDNSILYNFLKSKQLVIRPKELSEEMTTRRILKACSDLSTSEEQLSFIGYENEKFEGCYTKVIIYSSKSDLEYLTNIKDFVDKGCRPKRLRESFVLKKILEKCKDISTPEETITFLEWDGEFKSTETKIKLNNSLYGTWYINYYTLLYARGPVRPSYLTKENMILRLTNLCRELSTPEEEIKFLGFAEEIHGEKTRIILYNSKFDITWDTVTFNGFMSNKTKSPQLTERIALEKIQRVCEEISTEEEKIIFLGWEGGIWKGHRTQMILNNSKLNYTWTTTTYSSFISYKMKFPRIFDADYYRKQVERRCEELSTEEEVLTFLGWKDGAWVNSRTKLVLYNSKYDCTWDTTSYNGFTTHSIMRPSWIVQEKSSGERSIHNYLKENKISFKGQFEIDKSLLINCPNQRKVLVDFYLKYNGRKIFIEFNGEQHYKYNSHLHRSIEDFRRQLGRDLSLIQYAKESGIELLEIPYCDFSRIPEILEKFLEEGKDITTKITRNILSGPQTLLLEWKKEY